MRPIMMVAGLGDGWREARDGMGWTALMWAARRGDVEVVGVLLSAGCAVSGRNGAGRSVLHLLVMPARVEVRVVRLLLGAGAEVGAVDKLGVSVLEMARRNRNAEVVEALVEARCGKWC